MAACKANDQSALGGIPGVDGGIRAPCVSGSRAPLRGNRADSALELFSNYKAPTVSEAKRGPGRTGRPVRPDARDQCRPPSPTMKTGDGGRRYPAGGTRASPSLSRWPRAPSGRGSVPVPEGDAPSSNRQRSLDHRRVSRRPRLVSRSGDGGCTQTGHNAPTRFEPRLTTEDVSE
jgi:hypothetical protein